MMRAIIIATLIMFTLALHGQTHGNSASRNAVSACLSDIDRAYIAEQIKENKRILGMPSNSEVQSREVTDLIFPLELAEEIPGFDEYYGISNYVDHNSSSGIQDYNCQSKSYDGHRGTDIFTFPFPWYLYENDLVNVVSMFDGVVVWKQDGNFDMNCSWQGQWNAVYVAHEDGSVMWYGHLKSGSLTSKELGETVEKGEYLGVVASSGFSDGPHLHIEYYDEDDNLLDPFGGECNSLNTNSLWESQLDHTNPRVNAVMTHKSQPRIDCGLENDVSDFSNYFQPDEEIFAGVYITDYQAGDVIVTSIYGPDNNFYGSFNTFHNEESYGWFWNSVQLILTEEHPKGTWRIESKYGDNVVTHTFEFGDDLSSTENVLNGQISIYPNPSNTFINLVGEDLSIGTRYQVYDYSGKIVKKGKLHGNTLSIEELTIGLYFLVIVNDEKELSAIKFFKN